jgi:hypothetical protein
MGTTAATEGAEVPKAVQLNHPASVTGTGTAAGTALAPAAQRAIPELTAIPDLTTHRLQIRI